ncbi:Sulfur carrier protein adenylyltransferase [Streptomyces xanthophaeus]|uniref:ThiF family adenylyltransferase n=1 Tax=Streptomyces xanthophaeus TaxID=67385 RepID=UPI00233F501C|nr:ThiF family adenylyltransferase [Streptomyces xanthophaeus]WCD84199.1 Sulfur carrier protein adenylyltransferase [Streptomyces xanthophaeus]
MERVQGAAPAGRYEAVERVAALRSADYSLLRARSVAVIGCGALGSAVASHLVRGGVGRVRVIDRDVVELRNLTHQVLYTEQDAASRRLKAEAAEAHLRAVNAECHVEGVVADFAPGNALRLVADADLLVDGADNIETKLLLNDVAVATGTPLVYGGCAGAEGSVLAVLPGVTHCLRCLWPAPGEWVDRMTCETRGVLPSAAATVAALQVTEALKVLLGLDASSLSGLQRIDAWNAVLHRVPLPAFPSGAKPCPTCTDRDFVYLRGAHSTTARQLCGDDTVLLTTSAGAPDFERLSRRHVANASLRVRPEHVQLDIDGCRIVAFSSGRTLIHGAGGVNRAKAIYARHVRG